MIYDRKQKWAAWIIKYLFRISSPSATWFGYVYEWDFMKANESKGG